MEASELAVFMICLAAFWTLLQYPGSAVHRWLPDPTLRRVFMGLLMGSTAICIVYSPWGKQSGAHINPAVTLAFYSLGKIKPWDAFFYILAQFAGGIAGMLIAAFLLGSYASHPDVHYVVTQPGPGGEAVAFIAECGIAFVLMSVVLVVSNISDIEKFTGLVVGALVVAFVSLEAPFSGTSMNPARSLGSAIPAQIWSSLWIYFVAPPLGMLLAGRVYLWRARRSGIRCAKLHHSNDKRCIFCGANM
jgi:aquaporin Z